MHVKIESKRIKTVFMEDKSLLLTEEQLEYHRRFEQCTTIEELRQLEEEMNFRYKNEEPLQEEDIDMSIEEFKEKYGLIDIKDLKGKYGF